ncbi:hypothetical protein NXY00_14950 [Bacteroides sp. BFG-551]|nr:hypothetical protein [Bacteroides sp. BFG-551]
MKLKKDILATYRKRAINAHLLSKLRMIGVVMKVLDRILAGHSIDKSNNK